MTASAREWLFFSNDFATTVYPVPFQSGIGFPLSLVVEEVPVPAVDAVLAVSTPVYSDDDVVVKSDGEGVCGLLLSPVFGPGAALLSELRDAIP